MAAPPGSRSPLVWQSGRFLRNELPLLDSYSRRYGDVFSLKVFRLGQLIVVSRPDLIKQAFTGDPTVLHAGEGSQVLEPIVGPMSILLLDEQAHMRERKLLLPPFHGERMKLYEQIILEATDRELQTWPTGKQFSLHPAMQRITLKVILRAVFGLDEGARLDRLEQALPPMLDLGTKVALTPFARRNYGPWSPWPRYLKMRDQVDELLFDEIERRRATQDTEHRVDVLSLLLQARTEDGEPISDRELRDELITMLVAGHETTATSMAWTFERLLRNPQVLGTLRDSLAAGDDYVDAVIKESMRLRPVLGYAMRRVKQPMKLGEFDIPADSQIGLSVYLTHLRPDLYPDPHGFKPERFLDRAPETYNWIPFGGGIRRCLGASFALYEMRIVLRRILERCELHAPHPSDEPVKRRAITYVPKHGTRVVLDSRVDARDAEVVGEPALV